MSSQLLNDMPTPAVEISSPESEMIVGDISDEPAKNETLWLESSDETARIENSGERMMTEISGRITRGTTSDEIMRYELSEEEAIQNSLRSTMSMESSSETANAQRIYVSHEQISAQTNVGTLSKLSSETSASAYYKELSDELVLDVDFDLKLKDQSSERQSASIENDQHKLECPSSQTTANTCQENSELIFSRSTNYCKSTEDEPVISGINTASLSKNKNISIHFDESTQTVPGHDDETLNCLIASRQILAYESVQSERTTTEKPFSTFCESVPPTTSIHASNSGLISDNLRSCGTSMSTITSELVTEQAQTMLMESSVENMITPSQVHPEDIADQTKERSSVSKDDNGDATDQRNLKESMIIVRESVPQDRFRGSWNPSHTTICRLESQTEQNYVRYKLPFEHSAALWSPGCVGL